MNLIIKHFDQNNKIPDWIIAIQQSTLYRDPLRLLFFRLLLTMYLILRQRRNGRIDYILFSLIQKNKTQNRTKNEDSSLNNLPWIHFVQLNAAKKHLKIKVIEGSALNKWELKCHKPNHSTGIVLKIVQSHFSVIIEIEIFDYKTMIKKSL